MTQVSTSPSTLASLLPRLHPPSEADDAAEAARLRAAERSARQQKLLDTTWKLVPRKLRDKPIPEAFREFIDAEWSGQSFALLGPLRCGKSAACVRLVGRLCRKGVDEGGEAFAYAKSIFWARVDELTLAGGARDDEHAVHLLHRAEFARLLILDDMPPEPSKTFMRILQKRYDAGRATGLTCGELNEQALARRMGGAAVLGWLLEGGTGPGRVVIA